MTNLVVHGTRRTRKYRDTIQAASSFAQRNQLPDRLQDQMLAHLCLKFRTDSEGLQQQENLDALPKAIRSSISHYLFYNLVLKVYLFCGVPSDLLFQLVSETKAEYFPPREDVILQNEAPTDFYILITGSVVVGEAKSGEVFGEIGVLCYRPQLLTIRTKKLCQLLRLNRTSFLSIVQSNVGDGTIIMSNLLQYLKEHKDDATGGIFDEVQSMILQGRLDLPLTLCGAVIRGDDLILEQLLKRGLDPNESDITDHTALHIAASKGNENASRLLLNYGANPNSIDQQGSVPLWEAILGKHEPVIRLLLANGAKLSAGDVGQFACFASEENSLDLLKDIVRYGGDVTVPKSDGNTTLHLAVSEGNIETVKFLVNQGADIDKLNGVGWTPRGLADHQGHEEIKDFFQSRKAWTDDIDIKTGSTSPPVGQFIGGFRAEPTICRIIDEGSQTPRDKNHGVSGQPRRKTSTFENSLFGIMSAAHGNNNSDGPLSPMSSVSRSSSANQDPRRVTICCPEKGNNCGKLVLLPGSIEELLEVGANKFNFLPTKVFSHDRAEVSGLDVIRDGDRLLLVTDEWNVEFSNNSQTGVD